MSSKTRGAFTGCAVIAFAVSVGGAAFAEDKGPDEIIVTAQKREQRLKDVPIAVTAVGAQEIARAGVVDLRDLQSLTPSLNVSTNNNDATTTSVRIRGIGTTGNDPGFEGAVGTFVDGIYRSRSGVALTQLYDVKRLEILRGPQGTLFGKNTSAGAINIINNAPEFIFGGGVSIDGGNYGLIKSEANITGPLAGDKLAGRLSGFIMKRDGWQKNTLTGADASDRNRFGGRGQLLFKPNDDISFRLIADYYQANETGSAAPFTVNPSAVGIGPAPSLLSAFSKFGAQFTTPPNPFNGTFAVNQPLKQNTIDWGVSGELNWDLHGATLTNILAYRQFQNFANFDSDFTGADLLGPRNEGFNVKQTSEELRLAGRMNDIGFGHALNWLVGGYYAKEQIGDTQSVVFGNDFGNIINFLSVGLLPKSFYPAGNGLSRGFFTQDGETWSLFTHETWEITDRLSLTGGLRYNHESKTGTGVFAYNNVAGQCSVDSIPILGSTVGAQFNGLINNLCPTYNYEGKTKEGEFTGTGSIAYKFTEHLTSYLSYSHGYKAGGINLDRNASNFVNDPQHPANVLPPGDPTFRPEFADNYELGIKTQLGRTMVNFSAFYTKFTDFQLNTFNGLSFIVSNVKDVTTQGVELEIAAQPFHWLALTGGGSYIIAAYGKDVPIDPRAPDQVLAGRIITNAPRLTLNGSATFSEDIPNTPLASFLRLEASYHSTVNTGSDLGANKLQGPVFLMNGRLGLTADEGKYEISLWARNIFDRGYKVLAFDTPFQLPGTTSSVMGEPRTYGITGRMNF